jgi:hypothetical protein
MGGLPLALEQAGAYIETTGREVSGYLQLYEKYQPEIQKNQYGDALYYRTTAAFAWNIAKEAVQEESPAAIELLHLCAFHADTCAELPSTNLPLEDGLSRGRYYPSTSRKRTYVEEKTHANSHHLAYSLSAQPVFYWT